MLKRCVRRKHGAAKPKAAQGMLLCPSCLANDWRNYYVTLK